MKPTMNSVARGMVALVEPASKMQALQMRLVAGETKDNMEHFEPYGLTSNPLPGAEGVAVFVGGDRSHGIVVCVADRRFRLQDLKGGEVALYTDEGDVLHFKRGRVIEVKTLTLKVDAADSVEFATKQFNLVASEGVNIDTPKLHATGLIESDGDQVAQGVSQVKHLHDGVSKGTQQSGKPVVSE